MPSAIEQQHNVDLQVRADGHATIFFRGRLDAQSSPAAWRLLQKRLPGARLSSVHIDASAVEFCDGSGIGLLRYLSLGKLTSGVSVTISGLKEECRKLFDEFTAADYEAFRPRPSSEPRMTEEVGIAVRAVLHDLTEQVAFMGRITAGMAGALLHRKRMRWLEVKHVFELAGANALPIVSLISLLVGLIIAFQSTQPLAQFGAQVYIANMIGLMMVRELGPLMTAIMLAGRSGSAFAAEIGTMKVNEELNALETMGLDPVRFLVIQRIMAGLLLTPLLTAYSMFMGILGGVLVMLSLGFPLSLIYSQLVSSLTITDIVVGIVKAFVFGIVVASIGCLRGLQTQKGPSAVGQSTTRAVVSSILLIIIADAVFAVITFVLKI